MSFSSKTIAGLDPLNSLLGDVLSRLEALESAAGVAPGRSSSFRKDGSSGSALRRGQSVRGNSLRASLSLNAPEKAVLDAAVEESEHVKAYDEYTKNCVDPFVAACNELSELQNMGALYKEATEGIRVVVVLASKARKPQEPLTQVLLPHLEHTQEAVKSLRELRLNRKFDFHYKAVVESTASLSWVIGTAPSTLPVPMIKEALASAEFWSNRIRKEFKGKDEKQIAFCDKLKMVCVGLASYVEHHHKTGLTFNPKGRSLAEAAIRLSDDPTPASVAPSTTQKRHPTLGATSGAGGNLAGLTAELGKRTSSEGTSAATGLKKVTKDMQTWRKEYKKDGAAPAKAVAPAPKKDDSSTAGKKKKMRGIPIFQYQDRGFKWVVENHTKETSMKEESSKDGALMIEVHDVKSQVYLYNCDGVTVKVIGKFKSLYLDKCTNCAVVYDNVISSAEVINCKNIQLQVTGLCPNITIDKTAKVLIWLSKESLDVTSFTTSLSTEMNVNFPDGDDMKELPIPEQFVHTIKAGKVASTVSDLYS